MATIQGQRFGVEVETVGITRQRAAQAIQTVVGGEVAHVGVPAPYDPWQVRDERGRVWQVVADASLNDYPANLRAEIVTPVLEYDDIPQLQEVVRALRAAGAKATSTCGLHCHVDASPHTGRTLATLLKIVRAHEQHILEALAVRPDRRSRYARDVDDEVVRRILSRRPRTLAELNAAWYGGYTENPGRQHYSRYRGVNLNSVFHRGTVEFRWFDSTLHAGRVKSYLQLCLGISARALNIRGARSERRSYDEGSTRFDFRVFLLHLGLIGPEYATARHHLLANLKGSAAWRHAA